MIHNFKDKVVVITGASQGIGKTIALKFAKAGAKIVLIALPEPVLQETKKLIIAEGNEALDFGMDVSSFDNFTHAINETVKEFGSIDVLINNAGITRDNLIMRMKEKDWELVLDVNLKSAFNGIKAVTRPMMKARSGRIVNIASVIGLMGNIGQCNYAASKAGMIGLTKSVARELGSRNITVNAIAPGYILTDMTEKLPEEAKDKLKVQIPLKRLGSVDDVANMVLFLASDDASYVTGQTFNVDGGMVMY